MADDIRRWSDELAREPGSLVFLQLGDALRRQQQLDLAHKVALRGLERHPHNADAHDLLARIAVDRGDFGRARDEWSAVLRLVPDHAGAMKGLAHLNVQQSRVSAPAKPNAGVAALTPPAPSRDPRRLFATLLVDEGQTALLLDADGLVLGGVYIDARGADVSQDVGAQLSGISEQVRRSTKYLGVGDWRSITFETRAAVVAMAPSEDGALLVVAASKLTPLGLLRRLLDRCAARASAWLREGRIEGDKAS